MTSIAGPDRYGIIWPDPDPKLHSWKQIQNQPFAVEHLDLFNFLTFETPCKYDLKR
jgi:hypothetical protein